MSVYLLDKRIVFGFKIQALLNSRRLVLASRWALAAFPWSHGCLGYRGYALFGMPWLSEVQGFSRLLTCHGCLRYEVVPALFDISVIHDTVVARSLVCKEFSFFSKEEDNFLKRVRP